MDIKGWKYYNSAALPTTCPLETPDLIPVQNNEIWEIDGSPLLARWTTDFDSSNEGSWWYVVKDTPFDISELKAKRRYEINKGMKNFSILKINPAEHKEELYKVQVNAFSAYPPKYRPTVNKESFFKSIDNWDKYTAFAAFSNDTNEFCGYALLLEEHPAYIDFSVLKCNPECEKAAINAALVAGILTYYDDFLKRGGYICDGSRSINHETAFQDYLEKYFGFRKAYCRLHIEYNPKIKWIIKLIWPFRRLIIKLDSVGIIHKINGIMKMEEIVRSYND